VRLRNPRRAAATSNLPARLRRSGSLALGLGAALAVPASLSAQGESMAETYERIAEVWATNSAPFVVTLASLLVGLDIAMILLQGYREREGIHVTFTYIVRRIFVTGLGVAFFLNPQFFAFPLIRAFESAGTAIGGGGLAGLPDPSMVLLQGWDAFTRLMNGIFIPPEASDPDPQGIRGILGVLKDFFLWAWYIVSLGAYLVGMTLFAWVVFAGFLILALQITLVKAESFILISVGLLFVGMSGSVLTQGMAAGYVRVVLHTGVRIFLMSAFFGVYYLLLPVWEAGIAEGVAAIPRGPGAAGSGPPSVAFQPLLKTGVSICLFTYLVWKVPASFSERLMQQVQFSSGRGNDG
jgi:hypothetical protein